jgi:hypothetical protein
MLETLQKDKLKFFIHGIINYGLKSKVLYGSHKHWPHRTDLLLLFCMIIWSPYLILFQLIIGHILYIYKLTTARKKTKYNNTLLFGFALHFGWFKTIEMYFLFSGHTHKDIDQMFSTWNIHYWNSGLQLSLAVSNFFKWVYKSDAIRLLSK